MSITRDFKVYLNAGVTVAPVIHVNQYDQGETWVFTLYTEKGIKYTPSSGAICGIKSDGMGIINTAEVNEDGQVVVEETQQMTAAAGKAVYSLMIDDDTHYTANFIVMVEQSPLYTAIVSDSDLSLIQEALNSVTPAVIAQEVTDWMDDNITQPTTPVVDASLTVSGAAADAKVTGDTLRAIGNGLTEDIKEALLDCFANVAWIGDDGQDYYDALESALYPPANLSSITCVYTQSGTVYDTDSLDSLKSDLVVTAHYDDLSSETVTTYTLSGTLTVGTSTITVTYQDKTTTFTVTVSEVTIPNNLNFVFNDLTLTDGYINDSGEIAQLEGNKFYNELIPAVGFCLLESDGTVYVTGSNKSLRLAEYDNSDDFIARSYEQNAKIIIGRNTPSSIKMGFSNQDVVLANADRFVGLNVIDSSLCTIADKSIDTNGNAVDGTGTRISDFLPIDSGYVVFAVQNDYDSGLVVFYDQSKSFIERNAVVNGPPTGYTLFVFDVPTGAKYVRFRCDSSPRATEYVSYYQEA